MDCVFILWRDEEDSELVEGSLSFSMIDGEEISREPVTIDFEGKKRTRLTARIHGLVVPEPGILEASLHLEEGEGGSWKIQVNKTGEPEIEAAQADVEGVEAD